MDTPLPIVLPSTRPTPDAPPPPLPRWEQLPVARQRELILTLASLLVKRLPSQEPTPPEVQRE